MQPGRRLEKNKHPEGVQGMLNIDNGKKAETNIFTNQMDRFPVFFHHAGANAGDVMRLSDPGK